MLKTEAAELVKRVLAANKAGATVDEIADFVKEDFVPKDANVVFDGNIINVRENDNPLNRCTAVVGDDIQSGRCYCGKPADMLADDRTRSEAYVSMCREHFNQFKQGVTAGERMRRRNTDEY